jgi:hypothetical protein
VIINQTKTIEEQTAKIDNLISETDRQTNEIRSLNKTVAEQTLKIKDLNIGILELMGQVVSLGQLPRWSPKKE